jgi:prepilin-type N-terminal cleavage/methylation domain-containing protein
MILRGDDMRLTVAHYRRGMTLVELMVAVVILSLLAVTVLPALNRSPNKALLRDAAAVVQGHVAQGLSKSIGNRTGYGVWLDVTGVKGPTNLGNTLGFCPGVSTITGTTRLSTASYTATTATLTPPAPISILGSAASSFPAGTLISFMGYPYEYLLSANGSVASFRSDVMQTSNNTTFPYNSGTTGGFNPTYSWVVSVPPTRPIGLKSLLRGNACIDLGCSSIGINKYSNRAAEVPTAPLKITFDSTGQAKAAVYTPVGGSQKIRPLDAQTPIALLIGVADQVGNDWVANPTEDEPGSNLQRTDALWVVYDSRKSSSFVVENYVSPQSSPGAVNASSPHIPNAQKFVRQALLNRIDAN